MSSPFASAFARIGRTCLLLVTLAALPAGTAAAQSELDGPLLSPLPLVPIHSSELQVADAVPQAEGIPFPPEAFASPAPQAAPAASSTQPGVLEVRVHGPKSMRAKEVAKFAIEVINNSPVQTPPLRVIAKIPEHVAPLDLLPEEGCLSWPVHALEPGKKFDIQFAAEAKAALPIHLKVVAQVEIVAEHLTRVTQPQLQVHFQSPSDVDLGDSFDATLTISNPGSGKLTRGGLALHPSPGLQIADAPSAPQGPYDLGPGQSLQIPLKITAATPGEHQLEAFAEADGGLSAKELYCFTVHQPRFEIAISGPKVKLVGEPARFTLKAANKGDAGAKSTLAFLELPEELEFVSAEAKGIYDPKQHLVYWNLDVLQPGQQVTLAAKACPKRAGVLECRASVKDCLGTSAENYWSTEAKGQASVALEMVPDCDLAKVGDKIRYGFRLQNRGSLPATNVSLSVELPDGLTLLAEQSKGWTKSEAGHWQYRSIDKLAPEEDAQAVLVFKADSAGGKTVTAKVSSPDLAGTVATSQALRIFDLNE